MMELVRNGETFQLNANAGAPLGQDGFINFGFDLKNQDATTRAGPVSGRILFESKWSG